MREIAVVLIACALLLGTVGAAAAGEMRLAQATGTPPAATAPKPAVAEVQAVKVRGTISAIDKEKQTITLKGPRGRTLTLDVQDKSKLDAVKVGDPVVATYVEETAIEVKKAAPGATPSMTVKEERVGSKPGETPAGAIGRQVTLTGAITAVDAKKSVVTVKGPKGGTRQLKVKDPKNLENVKVGDMVELTFTQALAVALDKPAK
jgi:Cu/Ag efflux protein CusF